MAASLPAPSSLSVADRIPLLELGVDGWGALASTGLSLRQGTIKCDKNAKQWPR